MTVTVPVGPYESNVRWLDETIESIRAQTYPVDEILVIDDQANLEEGSLGEDVTIWKTPWQAGVAHAFNYGVGLARNELVFMIGSDDTMKPNCIELCVKEYEKQNKKDGYYWVNIDFINEINDVRFPPGSIQRLPCNEAFVTKDFWRYTGGFPLEAALGAPDSMFMEIMLQKLPNRLFEVAAGTPLVSYRIHSETETERSRQLGRFAMVDLMKPVVVSRWSPRGSIR